MQRSDKIKQDVDLRSYIEQSTGKKFSHANKINCPLHEDKTPSFALMNATQWRCFGCDKSGSIIDFVVEMEGISIVDAMDKLDGKVRSNGYTPATKTPAKTTQQAHTGVLYANVQDYAKRKYKVAASVFESYGCSDRIISGKSYMAIPARDTIDRLRNFSGKGAKYLPDWANPLAIEKKKRREAKKKSGEKLLPDDHIQAQWFGLPEAQQRSVTEHIGKNLVLCNGQTSTMVANSYGVPAFCKTDGENIIPQWLLPELVALLTDGWQLYVAMDCDSDNKGHNVAVKIITQLYQYHPVFIDLGGSDGYDLADFCDKYKGNSWDKLQQHIAGLPGSISEQAIADITTGLRDIAKEQHNEDKATLSQLIADVEARIEIVKVANKQPVNSKNVVSEAYSQYLAARDNPQWITGIRSGLTQQDYLLGGFQPGAVYSWVGETGSGKTTLAISNAVNMLRQAPGLVVIGEAGELQIINRLVGHLACVPWKSLRTGKIKIPGALGKPDKFVPHTPQQHSAILKAFGGVNTWQERKVLNLRDTNKPMNTVSLSAQLRVLCEEYGVKWAVMESADNIPTPGADSEYARISEAMFAFERMATDYNIPVLTSSQGGRNTKGRSNKKLGLHDGLGSNHVEGKSYALMTIYNHWLLVDREEITEQDGDESLYPKGTARIYVRKSRDDESGKYITAKFTGGCGWYGYEEQTT